MRDDTGVMSGSDSEDVSMPPVLVVALTLVSVILVAAAATLAPVALFAMAWSAPIGYLGAALWIATVTLTFLLMAGKAWARFGMILLPLSIGALALLATGDDIFLVVVLALALSITAVCLTFHPSSNAYFRAVAAESRG